MPLLIVLRRRGWGLLLNVWKSVGGPPGIACIVNAESVRARKGAEAALLLLKMDSGPPNALIAEDP